MREFLQRVVSWFLQKRNQRHHFQQMLILGILRDDGPSDEASIKIHLKRFTQNNFSKCVSVELPTMERDGLVERAPRTVGLAMEKWRITPIGWARHEEWKKKSKH